MRHPRDRYDSPRWMLDALFQVIPKPQEAIEICVGSGNWLKNHPDVDWITNDIDPSVEADYHLDASTYSDVWLELAGRDIITNPPYCLADPILNTALKFSSRVAFLMRANWEEPTRSRYPILKKFPYTAKIILPRYSFTRSSKTGRWATDSCTHHWYIWSDVELPNLVVFNSEDINQFSRFTRNPDEENLAWL